MAPKNATKPADAAAEEKPASVKDVLTEVGSDPEKAKAALDAENARKTPRKGLVAKLEKLVDADASLSEVDEDSTIDELLAAAHERKIDVPAGVQPDVLLRVIQQIDAAAAATGDDDREQPVTAEYVEREAGYVAPDYSEAQDKGYYGTNPDEAAQDSHTLASVLDGDNPEVNAPSAIVQPGSV